jgi:hypothetical protein
MDMTSGIFTAPRTGIYFFSFTGLTVLSDSSINYLRVELLLNGDLIGTGYVLGTNNAQSSPLTLQSTLNLKKGDQVWMSIGDQSADLGIQATLFDSSAHFTHFTGFMLEEEIVASF